MELDYTHNTTLHFLPGPIPLGHNVRAALISNPVSHRSDQFLEFHSKTKRLLLTLSRAQNVAIFHGSGTLANDFVGHKLKDMNAPGVILTNGEFGERLLDHACRLNLPHTSFTAPWGEPFDYTALGVFLEKYPDLRWIWSVHHETSTGILNDLSSLTYLSQKHQISLALDCISSLGTEDVDLSQVDWASASSGKGLASIAGLGMVFYKSLKPVYPATPRYSDLSYYTQKQGVPFTLSWNQLFALYVSLQEVLETNKSQRTRQLSDILSSLLEDQKFSIIAPKPYRAAGLVTIPLPLDLCSLDFGRYLESRGICIHYQNPYLLERNWIQIALMGRHTPEDLSFLLQGVVDARDNLREKIQRA